ncbi:AbrB/MazE/SpoVT family DNA-binding domain-containing protein [Polycladomyces sp. WAk]|uniref:AbrB/MazE/SpoVT family DNA-binding domain-containing protein n=1 Tax=Polycladomyces zharkentensis TaxID=2807616 RepID=A0ABS2WML8_9BACL|nr:AbrB/MazE/SpoVT family DNA-binding domain-containing protein [Polycladomyces sp. WAk]MBN2910822.1 AbrB/MazE/SpoVT family DNA-binding domain-containing protein [Polycladomyces sp. WAk]
MKTVKITSKGQMTLPKEFRDALGVSEGDQLILFRKGKQVILQSAKEFQKRVEELERQFEKEALEAGLTKEDYESIQNDRSDYAEEYMNRLKGEE